jgi:hypothetical protein
MLKVTTKIQTHKLSVVQLLVVYKHTHKTSEFASFNHHQFHPTAHSSSKKSAHLNHPHFHLFASPNAHQLFHNLPHLSFVKDHQYHQLALPVKHAPAFCLLSQFHHDRSSSNVSQLPHHDHVMSSSNVGFHMVLSVHDALLFNALVLLINMQLHAMLSFNMKVLKLVLFAIFNALVLLHIAQQLMFNNMVLHFLMEPHSSHKLALLVLLKILHHQVLSDLLVLVLAHMVKVQSSAVLTSHQ